MKLFGCTDDKNLVLCEMSADEIWKWRIDPWHLDLFDEEHVTIDLNGIKVSFSPLRQMVCVVEDQSGVFVGVYRRGRQHVFRAEALSQKPFAFVNVTPSSRPFEELFFLYLGDQGADSHRSSKVFGKVLPGDLKLAGRHIVTTFNVVSAQEGAINSYDLLFEPGMEMFKAVTLAVPPEPKISRILTALAPWSPVIKGRALTNLVCGLPVEEVHCFVRFEAIMQIEEYLSRQRIGYLRNQMIDPERPDYELEFGVGDGRCIIVGTYDHELNYGVGLIPPDGASSIELMECRQADQIRASRIALLDCKLRQQRSVRLWPHLVSTANAGSRIGYDLVKTDKEFRPISWRTLEEEAHLNR